MPLITGLLTYCMLLGLVFLRVILCYIESKTVAIPVAMKIALKVRR